MPYSPDYLRDGDYSQAVAVNDPRYNYPFRQNGDRASAYIEQDYWQTWATFTPQELIVPHPTFRDFYLVKESPPVQMGADLVQFTRTWARIPAPQSVYSTFSINKPALTEFATAFNSNNVTGSCSSSASRSPRLASNSAPTSSPSPASTAPCSFANSTRSP